MEFIIKFARENSATISKFAAVGIIATIIDFSIYIFMTDYLHIYYVIAAASSVAIAGVFNFLMNRRWTFNSDGRKRKQIPVFAIVAIMALFLNNGIIIILVEKADMWDILAKVIATAIVTTFNFLSNKYVTFRIQ